jgi:hypothetical protein
MKNLKGTIKNKIVNRKLHFITYKPRNIHYNTKKRQYLFSRNINNVHFSLSFSFKKIQTHEDFLQMEQVFENYIEKHNIPSVFGDEYLSPKELKEEWFKLANSIELNCIKEGV